jgi:hypothetical protein
MCKNLRLKEVFMPGEIFCENTGYLDTLQDGPGITPDYFSCFQ